MPSPEEMRELAEGIVASKHSRREAIASLQAEVRGQQAGYRSDHQAMAEEVRKELTNDAKVRRMGVRIERTGFRNDHQAMGKEVRGELAQAKAQLKADTGALMKGLKAEMKATRRAWQEGLKGAPPKPKPRARKKGPVEAAPPKKQAE